MQNTLVGYYLEIFLPVGMEIGMEVSYFALYTPDNDKGYVFKNVMI